MTMIFRKKGRILGRLPEAEPFQKLIGFKKQDGPRTASFPRPWNYSRVYRIVKGLAS
jgi:hypothetical protein